APMRRSRRRTASSRCGGSPIAPRSSRCSMTFSPKNVPAAERGKGSPMLLLDERKPLFDGPNWDFATLQRVHAAVEEIALGELGLDVYPNQIEVITSEQMLDAY